MSRRLRDRRPCGVPMVRARPGPLWLAMVACVTVGCATNLLVGADTEGGSGSGPADSGTPATTVDDGAGPTGTDAGMMSSETLGVDASATADSSDDAATAADAPTAGESTVGDASSTAETMGGPCEADNDTACAELAGCTWQGELDICTPTTVFCEPFGLGDCVEVEPCLWVGPLEGGEGVCVPGPCSSFDDAPSCEDTASCFWFEDTCTPRPCDELDSPVCEAEPECGLAGPDVEPLCVPADCLDGECFDLTFKMCGETPGCDYLGEPGDGTCMILECLPCAELGEEPQCNEVEGCEWDAKLEICVG